MSDNQTNNAPVISADAPATTPEPVTRVHYRMMRGEITALFIDDYATPNPRECLCYAHIGQHSSADPAYMLKVSRSALPNEYAALHQELERIGYKLQVIDTLDRFTLATAYQTRRAALVRLIK